MADHINLTLAALTVITWTATAATGNLMAATTTFVLLTALTATATWTATSTPPATRTKHLTATTVTATTTGLFILTIDHPASWMLPTLALAAGMRTPHHRRSRTAALTLSILLLTTTWIRTLT